MPEKTLLTSVEKTNESFQKLKKEYSQAEVLLRPEINVAVKDPRQIQEMYALIQKVGDNITSFHKQCEAMLFAMDQVCRPMLSKRPKAYAVRAVVLLTENIIREMDATVTNFQMQINGVPLGSAGSVTAEASTQALAMRTFWQQQYSMLPDYAEDQKQIAREKQAKEAEEKATLEQEVLGVLIGGTWQTVQDIQLALWERYTRQQISATLRTLVNHGQVERTEDKAYAYFAMAGTPKKKPVMPQDPQPQVKEELAAQEEPKNQTKRKKCPRWVLILAAVVLLAVAVVSTVLLIQHKNEVAREDAQQRQLQLVDQATQTVLQAISEDATDKIIFNDETKQALKDQGIDDFFNSTVVRQAVAEKLAQQFVTNDFDATLEFLTFLDKNYGLNFVVGSGGEVFDICFSKEYIATWHRYISEHAESQNEEENYTEYIYNGREFWFIGGSKIYITWEYTFNNEVKEGSVILGDTAFRQEQHKTYKRTSPGYFLVDEAAELVLSELEVVTGNCHRCSGTGKVTGHYGNFWNDKPGYEYGKRCGLCNGTGWK